MGGGLWTLWWDVYRGIVRETRFGGRVKWFSLVMSHYSLTTPTSIQLRLYDLTPTIKPQYYFFVVFEQLRM